MKTLTGSIFGSIAIFVWCLFMGVTVGSIGIGAVFPQANIIAKPFVCPNGKMSFEQTTSNPLPGTTYTQTAWVCIDNQTGAETELGLFPMSLYAGLIYGLLLYAVVEAVILLYQRGQASATGTDASRPAWNATSTPSFKTSRGSRTSQAPPAGSNTLARMERLKELRAANMISEDEYQQKRSEILKDL